MTFVYLTVELNKEFPLIEHIIIRFAAVFYSCNCAKTRLTVDYFRSFLLLHHLLSPSSVAPSRSREFFVYSKTKQKIKK